MRLLFISKVFCLKEHLNDERSITFIVYLEFVKVVKMANYANLI